MNSSDAPGGDAMSAPPNGRRTNDLQDDEGLIRDFIRQLIAVSGLSPSALARKARLSDTTVTRFLRGQSGAHTISTRSLSSLCRAAGVKNPFAPPGDGVASVKIPIRGYVKNGGTVYFMADDHASLFVEMADLPAGLDAADCFAVINRDDTNPPFGDGWVLVCARAPRGPEEMIGKVCLVTLAGGETKVRELRRSPEPGLYNLHAAAGRPLFDQQVLRCHMIRVFVQPV